MILRSWTILTIAMLSSHMPGQVTASLPAYVPAHPVTGVIRSWGSPEMAALMSTWEKGFRRFQPGVEFDDSLKGTSSAIAGIYAAHADLALLGRDIWPAEAAAFFSVYGYGPASIQVATGSFDLPKATYALMVFVHSDNPLRRLSLAQLEAVFGNDQGPAAAGTHIWRELGLKGEWADKPIHLYGFDLDNDKSLAFRRVVFKRTRRWNCRLQEFSDSTSGEAGYLILQALAKDPYGIAISNVHYAVPGTKMLALGFNADGPFVMPTRESVQSRIYPLVRSVHIVINRNPSQPIDPKVLEFLRYVLSRQGQEDVFQEKTYLPLTDDLVRSERSKLEVQPGRQMIHK